MEAPRGYQYRTEDAARRLAHTVALHQTTLSMDEILAGRYMAVRLADGGSDNTAYESRAAAIEHNRNNASRCIYLRIPAERWSPQTCDTLLWYGRKVYDAGHREDPAHQLVIPERLEQL